jgi:hypothetical protein
LSLRISVAMCTFNGARFLGEQLESIAAQIRLPDELIICDDNSTDETAEILSVFAKNAQFPVRIKINKSTLGATRNFDQAIALCQCEIIALADQDDVWYRHKLQYIAGFFLRSPETIAVFSDADIIDAKSHSSQGRLWDAQFFTRKEQRRVATGQALDVILKHPVVTGATLAFRERFRSLILPVPEDHVHDYWISVLLSACGDFQPISESLIQYRQHRDQQIGPGQGRLPVMERTLSAIKTGRQSYLPEVQRFQQVRERLQARKGEFPFPSEAIKMVEAKISHRSARTNLPELRLLRIPTVLGQVLNRGYWHYSEGWRSVAKDIFL